MSLDGAAVGLVAVFEFEHAEATNDALRTAQSARRSGGMVGVFIAGASRRLDEVLVKERFMVRRRSSAAWTPPGVTGFGRGRGR